MKFSSLIVFLVLSQLALGQELYGKYLGTERGLLSKECYDINFSKEGYLIVGTQFGPMKYDGERFTSICQNLHIERRIIYDFEKDPTGEVYMLNSKNELFILKGNRAVRITPKNSVRIPTYIHFRKIHWYSEGLIIFSNHLYYKYSFKSNALTLYTRSSKKKRIFVYNSLKEFPFEKQHSERASSNHTILFKQNHIKLLVKESTESESREDFVRIGNTDFVLINSTLYIVRANKVETLPYKKILFMESFHKKIWLATVDGLIELDENGNLVQIHFHGQVIGGITPLPGNGMVVSLNRYGIFICSNIHERFYDQIMPSQAASYKRTTLIGNRSGELFQFENNQLTKIHDAIKLNEHLNGTSKNIRRIEFIKDKWHICSIKGVYSLSKDLKKREKLMMNDYYSFNDFFVSKDTIYCISWSNITNFKNMKAKVDVPLIRCKHQLNDSVILLGSEEGLFKFHVRTKKLERCLFFPKPYYISHIQSISPNEFLICSRYKGIFHFKNGQLINKYESPCISVKKALISEGQIFVAGNQGIYVKPFNRKNNAVWTKIFGKEIQDLFLIKRKLLICADDDLITKEISSVYEVRKPAILLNEILLGDQKIKEIPGRINYNVPISLDFDILHFDANRLGLYYRLDGEVKIRKQTEGTKLNFEALPSGSYQLELFPVIDGKIHFSSSRKYRFKINQPFWESTLFYLLISIVIILILFSIRLVRNLNRKKRIAERAELESKLNEYKLLAVKAQVNPHFLSNGFAAIQALILKGDNDYAAHYLAKFSFLMRKVLYYSETQFISVNQELQLADTYLELELLRSNNRFKIRKEIQLSETQLMAFKIPSLLLQPILENAIWHGLKFQENNPELNISFSLNEQQKLIIEISDNGPGFNSLNKTEEHLSKGNKLITERIDTLNKQFQNRVAEMDILSSVSGTTVIFTFTAELYQSE